MRPPLLLVLLVAVTAAEHRQRGHARLRHRHRHRRAGLGQESVLSLLGAAGEVLAGDKEGPPATAGAAFAGAASDLYARNVGANPVASVQPAAGEADQGVSAWLAGAVQGSAQSAAEKASDSGAAPAAQKAVKTSGDSAKDNAADEEEEDTDDEEDDKDDKDDDDDEDEDKPVAPIKMVVVKPNKHIKELVAKERKAREALQENKLHQEEIVADYKDVDDLKGFSLIVDSKTKQIDEETQTNHLGDLLGDMWKGMREWARPVYEDHLEKKLDDLRAEQPKLERDVKDAHEALVEARKELAKAKKSA